MYCDVYFQNSKIIPYCRSAEVTNKMHVIIHIDIDVKVFVLGEEEDIVLKIVNKHKNKVKSKANRPSFIQNVSWGIAKLICKVMKKM